MSPDELTTLAHSQMPFTVLLGLEVLSGRPEEVTAGVVWKADFCTAGGLIHGGYLMAVADSIGALCAFLNLPDGATTSTVESKTNFFRPVTGGAIGLRATPVHTGGTIIVVQTDVSSEAGKLVSRTTQTQAVTTRGVGS